MRFLLVFAILLSAGAARADEPPCARLQGLNENAKVGEYCENFTAYSNTNEVKNAQVGCARFYHAVIHIVQHVCNYLDETEKFQANDATLLASLDKARGQSTAQTTAEILNSRARALSRKWWIKTMGDLHALDPIYRDYMENNLASLTRMSVDVLHEEVLGTTCGRNGAPLSLNLLGLGGLSTAEAKTTYEKIGPVFAKLSDRLMRNSNNFGNTAAQLTDIVSKASDITGLPGSGGTVGSAVGEGVAASQAEQATAAEAHQQNVGPYKEGMLRFVGGRLVAVPSAAATGSIGLFVNVGLIWIEHRRLDTTTGVFVALRAFVAGAGAVGALPSGGVGVGLAMAADAAIGWIEHMVRGGQEAELQGRLRTYLPFAKKLAQNNSLSTDISHQWHSAFRVDFTEVDPVSGQLRQRPYGMVTEFCK
jgi:hypothetical protein